MDVILLAVVIYPKIAYIELKIYIQAKVELQYATFWSCPAFNSWRDIQELASMRRRCSFRDKGRAGCIGLIKLKIHDAKSAQTCDK